MSTSSPLARAPRALASAAALSLAVSAGSTCSLRREPACHYRDGEYCGDVNGDGSGEYWDCDACGASWICPEDGDRWEEGYAPCACIEDHALAIDDSGLCWRQQDHDPSRGCEALR